MKLSLPVAFVVMILIALAGCTQGGEKLDGKEMPARTAPATAGSPTHEPAGASPVELAGMAFLPPEAWTDQGASGMRKASFTYGPVGEDEMPAEVTVFYFGSGQGGDIESNIRRWIGQMDPPEGQKIEEVVRRSRVTTRTGFEVHFVEVDGTYQRSMGGGPMTGGRTKAFPGWRMVGAIIEAPEGNVFFKLVGPDETARAMEESYREMLATAVKT
jgi:hypothetical protein